MNNATLLSIIVAVSALALGACATHKSSGGGGSDDTTKKESARKGERDDKKGPRYSVPKHPLMVTRSSAPRTSLAVTAENGFDIELEINREASVTYKKHSDSGVSTSETLRLKDALIFGSTKTTEVARLKDGVTLHRVDATVTVDDTLSVQSLMNFLKRIERHSFLTASGIKFSTAKKWWGVCRKKAPITISGWFARGMPSLPETQVHLPKVSATRITYAMIQHMREGQLNSVTVATRTFKASGTAKSQDALQTYISELDDAHRCIKSVDVDVVPAGAAASEGGGVSFRLTGKLKCRTR